jgi:hypothetical protein
MKRLILLAVSGLLLAAPVGLTTRSIQNAERAVDGVIAQAQLREDPNISNIMTLMPTSGTYVDGVGLILQQEVNLKPVAQLSPFRPSYSKEDIVKIRQAKLEKMPILRALMRDAMQKTARAVPELPSQEKVILSVRLFHWTWEDKAGLPGLVVMQGQKQALLQAPLEKLETAVTVREY